MHQIWVFDDYHRGDRLELLRRAVEDGTLTLHVADTLPPERAAEAHRRLAAGRATRPARAGFLSWSRPQRAQAV